MPRKPSRPVLKRPQCAVLKARGNSHQDFSFLPLLFKVQLVSNARSLTALHFLSLPSRRAFSRGRKAFPETAHLWLKGQEARSSCTSRSFPAGLVQTGKRWRRLPTPAGSPGGAGSVGCAEGRRALLGLARKTVSGVHTNSGPNSSILNQSPWFFWAGAHGCHPPFVPCRTSTYR